MATNDSRNVAGVGTPIRENLKLAADLAAPIGDDKAGMVAALNEAAKNSNHWSKFRATMAKTGAVDIPAEPVAGVKAVVAWIGENPVKATIAAAALVLTIGATAYYAHMPKDEKAAFFANDSDDWGVTKAVKNVGRSAASALGIVDKSLYGADGTLLAAASVEGIANKAKLVRVLTSHFGGAKGAIAVLEALSAITVADIVEVESLRVSLG
jgi:hypothetical protein